MRNTTPSLNALRSFEAAARHQSFARAAEELFVSSSAISQQVAILESHLGIKLFKRVKQRLKLTDAGDSYRLSLAVALDRIESATVDLISHGAGVRMRIGALPSIASYWLIPRMKNFSLKHPTISIQIVTLDLNFASAERAPNFEGGQIDVGLFFGDGHWANLISEKLMDERLIAIASPAVLGKRVNVKQCFQKLPLLQHSTRPMSWAEWFQSQNLAPLVPNGPSFEHFHMLVEAAKAGLGIALVPSAFVQSDIQRGELKRIGSHALVARRAYYTVFEASRKENRACSLFRDWLQAEASDLSQ